MKQYYKRNISELQRLCGVYRLIFEGQIVYVGQSVDVGRRVGVHIRDKAIVFDSIVVTECLENELLAIESAVKQSHKITIDMTMAVVKKSLVSKKEIEGGIGDGVCENCGGGYIRKVTFARLCCDKCRLESHLKKRIDQGLSVGGFYKALLGKA